MIRRAARRAVAWCQARPFLTALIVLGLIVVPGLIRVEAIANEANDAADAAARAAKAAVVNAEALEREAARSDRVACESRRDTVLVLRELVEVSYAGAGLNLTGLTGFADLPESVQRFFANLEARPSSSSTERRDQALAVLEVPVCPTP
jgi:hypothetical protein